MTDTKKRSVAKALTWRVIATVITIVGVWLLTKSWPAVLGMVGLLTLIKTVAHYFFERVWDHVPWGHRSGQVIWFTGHSGAGKTTLAKVLMPILKRKGHQVVLLDGDEIRNIFPSTGFSKEARNEHVKRVGYLASMLEKHGVTVLCSLISPYTDSREAVRNMCENFTLVHVRCPIEICKERDPKGLYKRVEAGEIKNFTGIDDPYELPDGTADLHINTSFMPVDRCIKRILKAVL